MAGTIPLSLTQQFDNTTHEPLSGGKIYFIQAGTTATPQNAYQDSGLTLAYANPYELPESGRIPQLFFADGNIKIRIDNADGVTQFSQDNLLVIGASSGGGGGATVDATAILSTGDMKLVYNTGALSGFVRANGRTIGNAASGATERANADTSSLFSFLYAADTNLTVSGGRGASAAADYAANKTITLPDCRNRLIAGLGDMGNSDAALLTSSYFGATGTTLGAVGGSESNTLTRAKLPTGITSTVTTSSDSSGVVFAGGGTAVFSFDSGSQPGVLLQPGASAGVATSTGTATSNNTSGEAHANVQPTILMTIYIKL